MKRIIYAWELGGGFGHIHAFIPIAQRLNTEGHEVTFVVRDLLNAECELNRLGFRSLQAPLWQGRLLGLPDPPANLSEILLHFGFLRNEYLLGLVRAWLELFRLLNADLVIGDYSPSALLAARIAGIPGATFGTGFCRPAPVAPLPNLRSWMPVPDERLAGSDLKVLDTTNKVLRDFGLLPLNRVADIFSLDEDFLCTFPELDHYPHRPGGEYWGAVYNSEVGIEIDWPGQERFRVFCYVKPNFPEFRNFLKQLESLKKCEIVIFAPGLAQAIASKYSSPRIVITQRPVRLDILASTCDLAVCHAGHGTISAMLQAGIPLLSLPTNLEQYITASRVVDLGAGLMVETIGEQPNYLAMIGQILNAEGYRKAARGFSQRHIEYAQPIIQERIYSRILTLGP